MSCQVCVGGFAAHTPGRISLTLDVDRDRAAQSGADSRDRAPWPLPGSKMGIELRGRTKNLAKRGNLSATREY